MPTYPAYSADFGARTTRLMQAKTHLLMFGDSQCAESRQDGLASQFVLTHMLPNHRPHYMIIGQVGGASHNYMGLSWGYTNATSTSYGTLTTDYTAGVTPKLLRPSRKLVAASNLADNTDMSNVASQGIWLERQNTSAAVTYASRAFPWNNTNGASAPWFHGQHMKSKMIVQQLASGGWLQFDLATCRSGASTTTVGSFVTSTLSAADAIVSSSWTPALADTANFQTSTAGHINDHYVQQRMRSTAGYNENGLSLVLLGAVFARCDGSGVIPWDSDSKGFGYDHFGRSGSGVTDWADNYCTQSQWQEYFTQTVLVPDGHTTIFLQLGHNVNGAGEQSGSPGTVTATWISKYQTIISRLKAAYAAAFPSGTLEIVLVVPWICTAESNFMQNTTSADSVQAAVETLASTNNCAWFSFYNYFNRVPPFPLLHASSPGNGIMLAQALKDCLDHATNFISTPLGTNPDTTIRKIASRLR